MKYETVFLVLANQERTSSTHLSYACFLIHILPYANSPTCKQAKSSDVISQQWNFLSSR